MTMTVEEFERLVSEWLDAPQHSELAAAVEAAVAARPAWARVRDEWQHLVASLRQLPAHGPPTGDDLRAAIRAAIAGSS